MWNTSVSYHLGAHIVIIYDDGVVLHDQLNRGKLSSSHRFNIKKTDEREFRQFLTALGFVKK